MSELAYLSATELLAWLRTGRMTSLEAVNYFLERIEKLNPQINAVIYSDAESARLRAMEADHARSQGISWGPLHGLPMTIKECYEVVGMPITSGTQYYNEVTVRTHADVVQKLLDAGAIIFGKTNLPAHAADWQTFNSVYGTTNNPWNVALTAGGSSGGPAAALAAGFTPLEVGSDLGGSIRIPAHYCGVYGLRPTYGVVSIRGHIPGPPGSVSAPDMAVAGPMARTPDDLELLLDVIGGPRTREARGWRLELPESRAESLQDFRVLAWFTDERCHLDAEVAGEYSQLVQSLREMNVTVDEGPPDGFSLDEIFRMMHQFAGSMVSSGLPQTHKAMIRLFTWALGLAPNSRMTKGWSNYYKGMIKSHSKWLELKEKRNRMRALCEKLFEKYDVLLLPVTPGTAFPHNYQNVFARTLNINGRKRSYSDHLPWVALATLFGLPAVSAPIGRSRSGLPVNVQIVGAAFNDRITIDFARKLAECQGGFAVPPGWQAPETPAVVPNEEPTLVPV
jgi:amidase